MFAAHVRKVSKCARVRSPLRIESESKCTCVSVLMVVGGGASPRTTTQASRGALTKTHRISSNVLPTSRASAGDESPPPRGCVSHSTASLPTKVSLYVLSRYVRVLKLKGRIPFASRFASSSWHAALHTQDHGERPQDSQVVTAMHCQANCIPQCKV